MAIIEVKNLSKSFKVKLKEKGFKGSIKSIFKPKYKTVKAVKNISFEVEKGEMIAFIGPNGAGKSTTIKMLTGILYPDKGNVKVMDIDPRENRKKLAYEVGGYSDGFMVSQILELPENQSYEQLWQDNKKVFEYFSHYLY